MASVTSDTYSRAVMETAEVISAHHDADTLLRDLACRLRKLMELLTVQVTLYDSQAGALLLHVIDPSQEATAHSDAEDPIEDSPARVVWREQQPLIVSATADEARFPKYAAWMHQFGFTENTSCR